MIDFKVQVLGGTEIAKRLALADGGVRDALRAELAIIGQEIVDRAQALAPKRTGAMASRIIWYFGAEVKRGPRGQKRTVRADVKWKDGRIRMTVRPTGNVAHLMERGVNATFQQRRGMGLKSGQVVDSTIAAKWKHAQSVVYQRKLVIRPRPFFTPAVNSVGGAAGVNARLQATIDRVVSGMNAARAA